MLVLGTMQLRLTATTLAGLQAPEHGKDHHWGIAHARTTLEHDTTDLTDFYERVAVPVDGRPAPDEVVPPVRVAAFVAMDGNGGTSRLARWVKLMEPVGQTVGATLTVPARLTVPVRLAEGT